MFYFDPFLRNQTSSGIVSSSSVKLLTTDPINHMTKASGEIISKVNRGGDAGADLMGNYLQDASGFAVTFLSTTLVFLSYSWKYGLIALVTFILVSLIIIWGTFSRVKFFTKIKNTFEDKSKQIQLETLTQASYIRSSFSTIEQVSKLKKVIFEDMIISSNRWRAGNLIQSVARCLYFFGFFILGVLVIQDTNLSALIKLGFLATYLRTSQSIFNAGSITKSITQNTHSVVELFNFIKNFGKQSFPVLEKLEISIDLENKIKTSNVLSIKFTYLYFDYGQKAKLFNRHSCALEVEKTQKNKLYGIIGPSGAGKTTFISILGGQLKPDQGEILINGIGIYKTTDAIRRQLIGVQMQTSTSLRGKLRHNLIFGIPNNNSQGTDMYSFQDKVLPNKFTENNLEVYTDDYLVDILKKVGLWSIFEDKNGLETLIGEGGLNLSGGQRQRLNFAGLYLRAKYFKPKLLLIDEPTSSLDEISERAITDMINELARDTLTLVVAHRLNTLNEAVAILDISLIEKNKELKFYARSDLSNVSQYYKDLVLGKAILDN